MPSLKTVCKRSSWAANAQLGCFWGSGQHRALPWGPQLAGARGCPHARVSAVFGESAVRPRAPLRSPGESARPWGEAGPPPTLTAAAAGGDRSAGAGAGARRPVP